MIHKLQKPLKLLTITDAALWFEPSGDDNDFSKACPAGRGLLEDASREHDD
jgi:hypothetical protein